MKKVLVTGGTGFIGNYVIEDLLLRGLNVVVTSRDSEKAGMAPWFDRVAFLPFDMSTMDSTQDYYSFFGKPDLVIHLAWAGLPNYKSSIHLDVNLPRQTAFLGNLISNGLRDLTVTGTCFEYGMQEGELSEDMPSHPANSYAIAKDNLRRKLESLQEKSPFSLKWTRLFYMFGKGQNPNSLLSQLQRAISNGEKVFNMSGGEQVRDFLPVNIVASHINDIALQNDIQGIINCCSGNPVKVKTFVENYLKSVNKSIHLNLGYYPYADYEPMRFWGSTKKLNKIIKHDRPGKSL